MTVATLVDQIKAALREHADPEKAAPMQAYMKSEMPYLGVRVPVVRSICRPLIRDAEYLDRGSWEAAIRELYDGARYREERYAALSIVRHARYHDYLTYDALPLFEHLIRTGAWWDLVDETSHCVGVVLMADRARTTGSMLRWARDRDAWVRRSAIICQLGHQDATDTELLTACILPNVTDRDFFIRKAIGWALREYAWTNPEWVREFVDTYHETMSALSRREATKHLGGGAAVRVRRGGQLR
jgi:3-methyladenine DNA glycosylase AlkD